jgi:aminotransferase
MPKPAKHALKHLSDREQHLPHSDMSKLITIAAESKDIISLGPGEPDFQAPQPIVTETKRIAGRVNHYAPPGGYTELKEALVKKLKKTNRIDITKDNVVVTTGSQEALMLASMSTLDPKEQIMLPNPAYLAYLPLMKLLGAQSVPIQLKEENNFEPNPDDIKKAITKKTKALLINTPANPTGNVISKKVLEELADLAIDNDLYIFSDEAYEDIIYDNAKHVSIASLNGMKNHAVSFYTFSKSYAMCGYRVGYAVGPKELTQAMTKIHVDTTICAPAISQKLALKALTLNKQRYIQPMVKEYDRRRKLIVTRLNDMGLTTPTPKGAFYTFSNIKHITKDSRLFAQNLLKKAKVAVVPGSEFGTHGEGYIRCSYATKYELIKKAMDRLEKFVQHR